MTFVLHIVFAAIFGIFVNCDNFSPKLVNYAAKISQNVGTKVKLSCFIQQGTKPFSFEWLKDNQVLFSDASKYRIETDEEGSDLIISNLDHFDSAEYLCTVRNEFGSDTQSTKLIVKGLIYFSFSNNMWRIKHKNIIRLVCFGLIVLKLLHLFSQFFVSQHDFSIVTCICCDFWYFCEL